MTQEQTQVKNFMILAQQDCPDKPTIPSSAVQLLRLDLIHEEMTELNTAFFHKDIVEVADAIADLLYVTIGVAVSCGIDIDPVFQEVNRSNQSKFINGYMREDGKWMKGSAFTPPSLKPIIEKQLQQG